jgi:putative transposase
LSKICQNLAFRYTRFYNWRYKTIGHLFQGRFKSILVDSNLYLKELIRYIHLNPVRAKLVADPFNYRWSSHQAYLMQQEFTWLARDEGLQKFAEARQEAVQAFHNFVISGIGQDDGIDFKKGSVKGILGDEVFIKNVQKDINNTEDEELYAIDVSILISVITDWYSVDIEMLQRPGIERKMAHIRSMAALLAREVGGISLRELDSLFRRADSTMSQAASRLEARMRTSEVLKDEFDNLQTKLLLAAKLSICQA